jgi:hypothetical protein
MTLFLAILLPTLASRGYWNRDNNSQQFIDPIPYNSRPRRPLLPETEQFLKSVTEMQPVSCRDVLLEEFDNDLLVNGIRALIEKGVKPKNILAEVVKAVESYPVSDIKPLRLVVAFSYTLNIYWCSIHIKYHKCFREVIALYQIKTFTYST